MCGKVTHLSLIGPVPWYFSVNIVIWENNEMCEGKCLYSIQHFLFNDILSCFDFKSYHVVRPFWFAVGMKIVLIQLSALHVLSMYEHYQT